jgi:hypothetical protein
MGQADLSLQGWRLTSLTRNRPLTLWRKPLMPCPKFGSNEDINRSLAAPPTRFGWQDP